MRRSRNEPCACLRKMLTVMGIIGKTHGVTSEISPQTAAVRMNAHSPVCGVSPGPSPSVLRAYELEAAGFGMQLMHQVGVTTLDQWYSDFVETDWRYVERYYQTDQLPDWQSCVACNCALVTPAPIPELRHREVEVRFAF